MKNCTALFAAVLMTATCYSQIKQPVRIDSGLVNGVPGRDPSITAFKGIPYAEPPVGNLRWAGPRAPRHWEGIRGADHFSDGCVQNFPKGDFPKSEDCLYLNVWTPAKGRAALPVMVYIHGGGLRVGSAREALYDGEELARKGIVVVTLNYRLGILGFFAHPELTKESRYHASGNYGLLDQNAALQWVHRNIAAFGGDPNKVTIFGQSGGAFSVTAQVVSPLSKGLFRAAIVESGGVGSGFARTELLSLEDGEKAGVKFAESVGAHSLVELRAMPAEKMLSDGSAESNLDGRFFPASPVTLLKEGKQNKVAMVVGSNSDEGQHLFRAPVPASDYAEQARKNYGADANRFLTLYPNDSEEASKASQQRMFADRMVLGEQNLAASMTSIGSNVYLYYFDYLDEGGYNSEPATLGLRLGADHGAELPYVFGLMNHWKAPVPDQDIQLQNKVMQYWTNFAKNLDPNDKDLPVWSVFRGVDSPIMILDKSPGMRPHPRAEQVEFLRSHGVK
ncbi:MAG TPA: carboxylesterase family protein [Candidatus Sulfotelmatobacter sp.]|nr:carboxylesterase family protein [Candidatus Sulfotelmatobacter sp.]